MSRNPLDEGYKMVSERHAAFVTEHPNGLVRNTVENFVLFPEGNGFVTVKSEVWKDRADADAGKLADGYGNASMPIPGPTNFTKNSEVENAETSALGRALAMIGYHPKETMASGEEVAAKKGEAPGTSAREMVGKGKPASGPQKSEAPGRKAEDWHTTPLSATTRKRIFTIGVELGLDKKALGDVRLQQTGKHSSAQMTEADGQKLVKFLTDSAETLKQAVAASGGELVK